MVGFELNNVEYYYVKNLQGDVTQIVDKNNTVVVEYTYEPFGGLASMTGSLKDTVGKANPIRYRSYYFDDDMGFYYLNSRYYDPVTGRFLSVDGEISGVGGDILGYNLYSYCMNNPVNMEDPSGCWPKWIGKAIAVVAVAAVVVAAVAITVTTFGAGSVAGVAAITAGLTIAARAAEVAALQVKKSTSIGSSSNKNKSSNRKNSANNSGGSSGSSGGGSSQKKNGSQVAVDVVESLFDNGPKIIGFTPFTKVGAAGAKYLITDISKYKVVPLDVNTFLHSSGGKVIPYAMTAIAWGQTTISIFSEDPVKRAEDRGYKLK